MAALCALEARSVEFMREKEEKRELEERICELTSQMIVDSKSGGTADDPQQDTGQRHNASQTTCVSLFFQSTLPLTYVDQRATVGMMMRRTRLPRPDDDDDDDETHETAKDRSAVEYDARLAELERERESIEQEKAQVERYKQLLLKQRDIMIALTQRLNERDEQITAYHHFAETDLIYVFCSSSSNITDKRDLRKLVERRREYVYMKRTHVLVCDSTAVSVANQALQDELDAYDKNQAQLENKLDEKTAQCIHLQRISLEQQGTATTEICDDADSNNGVGLRSCTNSNTPSAQTHSPSSSPKPDEDLLRQLASLRATLDARDRDAARHARELEHARESQTPRLSPPARERESLLFVGCGRGICHSLGF